jgi:hypothetical protein
VARPRTVQLGQFTEENAERVMAALEDAGIVWWHKQHGRFVQLLSAADWGVRVFVEADRLEDARGIARDIVGDW